MISTASSWISNAVFAIVRKCQSFMSRKFRTQIVLGLISAFVLGLSIRLISGLALHPFKAAEMYARDFWTLPLFNLGRLPVTPLSLFKTFVFIIALNFACAKLRGLLYTKLLIHTGLQPQNRYMLARFGAAGVFTIGLMVGLESVGLNLNTLTVVGGTLGIGIGFGLQSIAANWIAGIVMLMERSIRIGDRIDVKDTGGVVIKIGGRSTWVRTYNDQVMVIPNSEFINHQVVNWTVNDSKARLAIPIGVGYNNNLEEVRRCLLGVARQHSDVLLKPAPDVVLTGIGASSLDFLLRVWIVVGDDDNYRLKSDLYLDILDTFRKQNIQMPSTLSPQKVSK